MSDIRAALERLIRMHELPRCEHEYYDAMTAARAALAEPVGEQHVSQPYKLPEPGEVGEVVKWLRSRAGIPGSHDFPAVAAYLTRAATLLERQEARIADLRLALRECGRAVGSLIQENCSDSFLLQVPDEIRLAVAKAAPPAPEPGEGPTDALVDDLFNRFADSCDEYGLWSMGKDGLRAALRAAVAQPERVVPTDEAWQEFIEQVQRAQHVAIREGEGPRFDLVECALALWREAIPPAPALVVVPVAVSERLPGEGDCDAYERCWWWTPCVACWEFRSRNRQMVHDTHWLPAHAIPLPQVGEVEA
jgi:hypothetical protein